MSQSLIYRDCPVCDSNAAQPHWQKGDLRVVRCGQCGMVYANPVPSEMAGGSFYEQAGEAYYLSPAKLESDYAGVRFERELRLFRKHCPHGSVLDVGCSSGAFLFQLRQRWLMDYRVLGTDVSGAPLDYAESRGVPVVRGDFPEQDFKNLAGMNKLGASPPSLQPHELSVWGGGAPSTGSAGCQPAPQRAEPVLGAPVQGELPPPTMDAHRGHEPHQNPSPGLRPPSPHPMARGQRKGNPSALFDAITFWATLEHLSEPRRFLEKAHSLLKPGGHCFVLVPNLKSLAARWLGAKYRYVYPQHLNYFSATTLSGLSERAGFQVVARRFTHFNPVVIWQDWRRGGREVSNVERGELLKQTTALKQKPQLRPVKWCYGVTESILGCAGLADNVALVLRKPH